jgi:hypothetical protein
VKARQEAEGRRRITIVLKQDLVLLSFMFAFLRTYRKNIISAIAGDRCGACLGKNPVFSSKKDD